MDAELKPVWFATDLHAQKFFAAISDLRSILLSLPDSSHVVLHRADGNSYADGTSPDEAYAVFYDSSFDEYLPELSQDDRVLKLSKTLGELSIALQPSAWSSHTALVIFPSGASWFFTETLHISHPTPPKNPPSWAQPSPLIDVMHPITNDESAHGILALIDDLRTQLPEHYHAIFGDVEYQ